MSFSFHSLIDQTPTVWEYLQRASLPIVLYGTGDGADKIIRVMDALNIPISAIFVSDDFYRNQQFHGFQVTTLSRLEASLKEFIIVIAFGSHLSEIIHRVKDMAKRHPLVIPDVPVYGDSLFDRDFALAHLPELEQAYSLLADEPSRQVFQSVLSYKLSGLPAPLFECTCSKDSIFSDLIPLHTAEDYLDLGAYRGDTIDEFLSIVNGRYHSITALEPDARSFKKLMQYAQALAAVQLLPYGVSDKPQTVYMKAGRGRGSAFTNAAGGTAVQMTSVDALGLSVSYLKMDVEGSEAAALRGAKNTLQGQRPKLNIACYHRSEDLYLLPLLIHELQPAYQIFMRRHPCLPCWDLNLYCR